MGQEVQWTESDTELFLQYGKVFAPERDEWAKAFIELIPRESDESFVAVDLATGGGWLSEAILTHFPKAEVIALDGSEGMLQYTKKRLHSFESRLILRKFDLLDDSWLDDLPSEVDCFVSSLAIHHLTLEGKQRLFKHLFGKLNDDGSVLIADIMKPASEKSRRWMSKSWDEITRKQSVELQGDLKAYNYFIEEKWNLFDYPDDPIDKPSTLFEQLRALEEAGFSGVDAFWAKSGHALFGGYKWRGR